jgi:hypothetical protein
MTIVICPYPVKTCCRPIKTMKRIKLGFLGNHERSGNAYRKGDLLAHALPICFHQRESMGLLEYQGHAFLRDVAHDGVSCTYK